MKILLIYYEPIVSGQTTHVKSLAEALVLRGHDVTVVIPEVLQSITQDYINARVKIIIIRMRKLVWPVKSIIALLDLIRHERYEIVHVHSQEAGVMGRCIARLGNIKKIFYTPQTVDIGHSRWQNIYILLERRLASFTTRIFSVNQTDAKRMAGWGIPVDKICVIPNGIDLNKFEDKEDPREIGIRLGLNPDHPIIMQVGRLSPQKDPEMFVNGARIILQKYPETQMVWIGEGPLFPQIKTKLEALHLQDKIRLLGRIDQAYHCMGAADVVTSTSRWEGLPYSLLEAMACSKPVVATSVNGCSEVVINGQNGYLVESGDVTSWAESIVQLISDPQRARSMGCAGRRLVAEKYTLSNMVSRIEQAYLDK